MFCALFFSFAHSGVGVSYTCTKIAEGFVDAGADTRIFVPWKKNVPTTADVRGALPAFAGRWMMGAARRRQERLFFNALIGSRDPRRLAYLWPSASIELVRELSSRGVPTVREMINCHVATSKRILDHAFDARGLGAGPITAADIAYEDEVLRLVDWVVAPGPSVVDSLIENGVARGKIIDSTYGWEPSRVPRARHGVEREQAGGPTFLFVGTICLRKGVDTLIRAWREAAVPGRLVLLGGVDPEMASFVAEHAVGDIVHLPFSKSVADQYGAADVFMMPSLEEGGPLVTYEALGAGLPIIATRMGGGYALEVGGNGLLVADGDQAGFAAAIRSLAADERLRTRFGARSAEMAEEFTWPKVARKRADAIIGAIFG